jgi:hypothetical protein
MTEEQINKVVKIHDRIASMVTLKKKMEENPYRLTFEKVYGNSLGSWEQGCIDDILKKHDKMIRQEIDERITELKEELEKL